MVGWVEPQSLRWVYQCLRACKDTRVPLNFSAISLRTTPNKIAPNDGSCQG